jgi:hypothetical protein
MSRFRSPRPEEGEHLVAESCAEVARVEKEQGSEGPLAEIGHVREGCLVGDAVPSQIPEPSHYIRYGYTPQ